MSHLSNDGVGRRRQDVFSFWNSNNIIEHRVQRVCYCCDSDVYICSSRESIARHNCCCCHGLYCKWWCVMVHLFKIIIDKHAPAKHGVKCKIAERANAQWQTEVIAFYFHIKLFIYNLRVHGSRTLPPPPPSTSYFHFACDGRALALKRLANNRRRGE